MARVWAELSPEEVLILWQLESVANNTDVIKDSSWLVSGLLHNRSATTAPTTWDDSDDWYAVWSRWIDTTADKEYVCLGASVAAAVWTETTWWGWGWTWVSIYNGTVAWEQVVWDIFEMPADAAFTASAFKVSLKTLPTWADLTVTLYKNWTSDAVATIATTDSATNWLYIDTITSFTSGSYSENDRVTVSVTQIGSSIPGNNLSWSLS